MKLFTGKVALVTGGGSGIGRATAVALAREEAKVVVADVSAEGGNETVQTIKDAGGEALFVRTDVSKARDVEKLINRTVTAYGPLDIAHNNAGTAGKSKFALTADFTEEAWDHVMGIDLRGAWLCMKYEISEMLKQRSGAIVNTTAAVVLSPMPGSCAYGAAKAGLVQLTKTAALEYAPFGIRINAVAPGGTRTPMLEGLLAGRPKDVPRKPYPIGRAAEPEEIAAAVVWLCSEAASFAIGSQIVLDGGYSLS